MYELNVTKEANRRTETSQPISASTMCYDLDAISLALIILSDKNEDVDSAMDEILRYRNDDGIVMVHNSIPSY